MDVMTQLIGLMGQSGHGRYDPADRVDGTI